MTAWHARRSSQNVTDNDGATWNDKPDGTGNWLTWASLADGDIDSSVGAITWPITVNNHDTGLPISGVEVWVTSDSAGTNVIQGPILTDALGIATFYLDAGTYYAFRQKSGITFTNPATITVVAP